jgi:acyl-CoA-binding protein
MRSLPERFTQAQQNLNALPSRPDNDTMLNLYSLLKQATEGDVTGDPPGGFEFVARAKFDAWSTLKGTSASDAMEQYVDLVTSML